MSELIDNSRKRMDLLKHLILEIHKGSAPEQVKTQLGRMLGTVPYGEVMTVEQELISEGLPHEEVLHLCDMHTAALEGKIDLSQAKEAPEGHPVHVWRAENDALETVLAQLTKLFQHVNELGEVTDPQPLMLEIRSCFNDLMDVDKHYRRKENLLFPYMEKHGITGPPKVMWGKHDEARRFLKEAMAALGAGKMDADEAKAVMEFVLKRAASAVEGMIFKEENILFPMCLDTLSDQEWLEISEQSPEIGFCLYDPKVKWIPEGAHVNSKPPAAEGRINFDTGSFLPRELEAMLNTLPVDITFVDAHDRVKYFSHGEQRIFDRNRAILGREVQFCHPPHSMDKVNQILSDFRSGRQNKAEFWIQLHGKFIFISYYAVRSDHGEYLGTLEVTMDLMRWRTLEGERRLLTYETEKESADA